MGATHPSQGADALVHAPYLSFPSPGEPGLPAPPEERVFGMGKWGAGWDLLLALAASPLPEHPAQK